MSAGRQPYLQFDGKTKNVVCRIVTQGDESLGRWVRWFKLKFSDDGKTWVDYKENGQVKVSCQSLRLLIVIYVK